MGRGKGERGGWRGLHKCAGGGGIAEGRRDPLARPPNPFSLSDTGRALADHSLPRGRVIAGAPSLWPADAGGLAVFGGGGPGHGPGKGEAGGGGENAGWGGLGRPGGAGLGGWQVMVPPPPPARARAGRPPRGFDGRLGRRVPPGGWGGRQTCDLPCRSALLTPQNPAAQVLRSAFPGVRVHDDVTTLEAVPEVRASAAARPPPEPSRGCSSPPLPPPRTPPPQATELLAAGFPCVDVSRAGLRRGLDGQSTGLVRHVFRLLRVRTGRAGASCPREPLSTYRHTHAAAGGHQQPAPRAMGTDGERRGAAGPPRARATGDAGVRASVRASARADADCAHHTAHRSTWSTSSASWGTRAWRGASSTPHVSVCARARQRCPWPMHLA